jgi:hypothetical protein
LQPRCAQFGDDGSRFAASFTVGAVMRTIWQPTATRSSVCFTLAAVSIVSQVIMDCMTTGVIAADDDAATGRDRR